MTKPSLAWLPEPVAFAADIRTLEAADAVDWAALVSLANLRLDFLKTERLDRLLRRHHGDAPPTGPSVGTLRLAVLASSTTTHLAAALRVAALRRNLWLDVFEGEYGQYLQELEDTGSALHAFAPEVVLFCFDAAHLCGMAGNEADASDAPMALLRRCWGMARRHWNATVLQQTVMPTLPTTLGNNEQRDAGSPAFVVDQINTALRREAASNPVHLVSIDRAAARDGLFEWHDPVLWHRAKQEVSPVAAPVWGDQVARVLAALLGRSAKCLVLDLDNTLWGGVIGDDGLDGIVIGQGSALGEAFLAVQQHAKRLAQRGVILAVCSKNDEANALAPFDRHPDMVLRRSDIAAFVANWEDKASNLRRIAATLRIGLDSLVFLDDNPFERNLVRAALPEVSVPEIPDDDPALVPQLLADAGYFEALSITDEDQARTAHYQANRARDVQQAEASDLGSYLRSLEMRLVWSRFDRIGLSRITQLINKTNQFNLTTRRRTQDEVALLLADPNAITLQFRLIDRFGDNGIIAVLIGHVADGACAIDSWLMSCRVLGRGVEQACMSVLAEVARAHGAEQVIGTYSPTAKNAMVASHYVGLGFTVLQTDEQGGHCASLRLQDHRYAADAITIVPAAEQEPTCP